MTLSSLIGSLTRREPPPIEPALAESNNEIAHLLQDGEVRFVPPTGGEPDLGPVLDVRERIADVLPGVAFNEDGQGAFTRTGYALEFDTGADDRVTTVRVHVVGGTAAIPPLQRLIAKTGWHLETGEPAESGKAPRADH